MHQIKLMQKKLFDLDWRGNWHSFLLRGYIENKKRLIWALWREAQCFSQLRVWILFHGPLPFLCLCLKPFTLTL